MIISFVFQTLHPLGKSVRAWAALSVTSDQKGLVPSIYPSHYMNMNIFYVNGDVGKFGKH